MRANRTHPTPATNKALQDEVNHRAHVEHTFYDCFGNHMDAVTKGTYPPAVTKDDFGCYTKLIAAYDQKCTASEYSPKFYGALLAECKDIKNSQAGIDAATKRLE